MPITQLSYHICDFLQDDNGRLYILEFGDAYYNSSFNGRLQFSKIDTRNKLIPEHIATLGKIKHKFESMRSMRHAMKLMRYYEDDDFSQEEAPVINQQEIHIIIGTDDGYTMKDIQESYAHNKTQTSLTPPAIILSGSNDMMFLINRDKRILNTMLSLNGLNTLQPRSWNFDCKPDVVFVAADDVTHFVIKPTDRTLSEGILVVAREDLTLVLNAITHQDISQFTPAQLELYKEGIIFYAKAMHKNLLIQELHLGKTVTFDHGAGPVAHHTAVRAVFAVIQEDEKLNVEIVDIFWQLAMAPANPQQLTNASVISTKARQKPTFNCWPSLDAADKESIESKLLPMLKNIMQTANTMDVRSYVLTLAQQNKTADIEYFLKYYGRIRVNRLDQEYIDAISKINLPLAQQYLLEQVQDYLLGHHLQFVQDKVLEQWLVSAVPTFSPELITQLREFIKLELTHVEELNLKIDYSSWRKAVNGITELLNKVSPTPQPVAQLLPFFANKPSGVDTTVTPSANPVHSPATPKVGGLPS
jgi:hypothetical protein